MKTWVQGLISILASGVLSAHADAQITQPPAKTTNIPLGIPPVRNAINSTIQQLAASKSDEGGSDNPISGAPSMPSVIETNPSFGSAFQNKIGSQVATTTNVPLGIPPVRNPINSTIQQSNNPISGVPSIIETNPFFKSAFQSKIGSQVATTTNFFPSIPPQSTTNPFSASAGQSEIGGQSTKTITNFLFASSPQSWVGQGQGVFATPTNGYDVSLTQISPNILQFIVTATNSNATNWLLGFSLTNDFFSVGAYSNAVNAGGSPARLVFGGMGRGDNTSDGAFNVLEASYSNNQIVSFAADFIQLDNDDTNSWSEGSIRYNSTIPDSVNLFMAPVAMSFQKGNAVLTWSTNLAGFQLEYATNLPARSWFTNNSVPAIVGGQYTVTVTNGVSAGPRLYRLMKPL